MTAAVKYNHLTCPPRRLTFIQSTARRESQLGGVTPLGIVLSQLRLPASELEALFQPIKPAIVTPLELPTSLSLLSFKKNINFLKCVSPILLEFAQPASLYPPHLSPVSLIYVLQPADSDTLSVVMCSEP